MPQFADSTAIKSIAVLTAATALAVTAFVVATSPKPIDRGPIIYVTKSGDWSIRTTIEHGWYPGHVGVVDRIYFGAWGHFSIEPGEGTFVRLHKNDFLLESFDGGSFFVITFQLPPNPEIGKPYELCAIPVGRKTTKISDYTDTARMRPGEFTAFQYGNPVMGWLPADSKDVATVTVLQVTRNTAKIHVKLNAELKPVFDFDLDDQFDLRTMADGAR